MLHVSIFFGFLGLSLLPSVGAHAATDDICLSIVVDLPDNGPFEENQIDDNPRFSPGYLDEKAQLYPATGKKQQDIRVCAQICPDKGGEHAKQVAELAVAQQAQVIFGFLERSNNPGIATNYPLVGDKNLSQKADITFENGSSITAAPMQFIAPGRAAACVPMEIYDYGAYSKLYAHTTVETGDGPLELVANETVPLDDDDNHIADADAEHNACVSPIDDLDATPVGDGYAGDGLSCFEEWRGFISFLLPTPHIRTHPKVKTLFILDDSSVNGLKALESSSGLEIYTLMGGNKESGDFDTTTRIMNPNVTPYHLGAQYGLHIVMEETEYAGYAQVIGVDTDQSTPKTCSKTVIDRSSISHYTVEYNVSTYVHEVMHCLGVPHHGDNDITTPSGSLAKVGGQHSGDQTCVMRYSSAVKYKPDTFNSTATYAYYPPSGPDESDEETALCTSKAGTGTNGGPARLRPEDNAPYPKTGNATHGDCAHSFRVKDF